MKKPFFWRLVSLLLVALLLVSAVSCDLESTEGEPETTAADTTADTTTEEEIPTETESEPQKPAEDADDGNYRILLAADLHCTHQETWYGVAYRDRMQRWVDAVLAEHERDPIDLLLIAGDISLDHWAKKGSYTVDKVSASKVFIDDFLSQIRPHIPVFVLAGNHEQYSNEQWKTMTGNDRRGTAVVGGSGTLLGCMLGTALIVVVENSMILIGIPTVWKDFFVGALIIIGTGISAMRVYTANRPGARALRKEAAK